MSRLRIATLGRLPKWLLVAALGASNAGCSLIFVKEPSEPRPRDCTSSAFAPVLDTILGGYQVVRTGAALGADDSVYEDAPINRTADVALGIGFTTLFVASAAYGYVNTSKCSKLKRGEQLEQEAEDRSDPWKQDATAGPAAPAARPRQAPASLAPAAPPRPPSPPAALSAPPVAPSASAPSPSVPSATAAPSFEPPAPALAPPSPTPESQPIAP